jgi:hypothetical protein
MPATVEPPTDPTFKIPSGLLEVKSSATGEAVFTAIFNPFKQLVEENIVLVYGLVALGICVLVGSMVIKWVAGQGGPRNPHLTAYERASWTEREVDDGADYGMGEGPGS